MSSEFARFVRRAAFGASLIALAACSPSSQPYETAESSRPEQSQPAPGQAAQNQTAAITEALKPASSGYAEAAEGLRVHYEIYGQGEPIVVMAGGFGDASSMTQVIGPLSRERQVISIDL